MGKFLNYSLDFELWVNFLIMGLVLGGLFPGPRRVLGLGLDLGGVEQLGLILGGFVLGRRLVH